MPVNNSHFVIERPELVNLVKPPTIIIKKTSIKEVIKQYKKNLFIFFVFAYMINNIYWNYIIFNFYIVAMVNKNILKIRKELDKLDIKLLDIVKKRTTLVDKVIKNKQYKKDIVDKKRIAIILKRISIKSKYKKIDPKITHKIWRAMIKAFIEYEFRNFKKK